MILASKQLFTTRVTLLSIFSLAFILNSILIFKYVFDPSRMAAHKSLDTVSKAKSISKIAIIFPESPQLEANWIQNLNKSVYELYSYPYTSPQRHIPQRIPKNKGNEAMTYLSFIIDHYDDLPEKMFFMHGHETAWHQGEMTQILSRIQWDKLPDHYVNIRECADSNLANPEDSVKSALREMRQALNSTLIGFPSIDEMDANNRAFCCSQFIIQRGHALKHSREVYMKLRDWLIETKDHDYVSGRVFEYFWHILFTGQSEEPKSNCSAWLPH